MWLRLISSQIQAQMKEEIEAVHVEDTNNEKHATSHLSDEMRASVAYKCGKDPGVVNPDVEFLLGKIDEMSDEQALDILNKAAIAHMTDPNFPQEVMAKIQLLIQGPKIAELEQEEFEFQTKLEAVMIHYSSPYPEVRSVADPYDDPSTTCESFRAYILGVIFMAGASALNTFFAPRQPAITIGTNVLQLLLAPCGKAAAFVLPDWGFTLFGSRYTLNPGPWTIKEQVLATIIFNVANGAGFTYYTFLVQKLPQYLGNDWVSFGYQVTLALSVQFIGFGYAGIMRRICVYPIRSIWQKVLPPLALNRALIDKEKKESVNGWKLTRYRFFMACAGSMFLWYFIPNYLFQALRLFNWMTWIKPDNFTLNMVTGSYGGMGFNPLSTLDWNVSGTTQLTTPFFSTLQQYIARFLSGIIIIAIYWTNFTWASYTPINSNEVFANNGEKYNVSNIIGDDGIFNETKYQAYSPPYYSGANVFGYGSWCAWYSLTLFYVVITEWSTLKESVKAIYRGLRYRESAYSNENDPHCRMMREYKEVPDWWFLLVLGLSVALGIVALKIWPTGAPVWSIFTVLGISIFWLFPSVILTSVANVEITMAVIFQILGGLWFPGSKNATSSIIIFQAYGTAFDSQAQTYISDQKMAHYAKVPPRAIFRGQMLAVMLNCFIFIGMLNWMVDNVDGVCQWDNPDHFVCTNAVLTYANSIMFGAFGFKRMCKMYPHLPYCFLIGALIGVTFAVIQLYGRDFKRWCARNVSEAKYEFWDKSLFRLCSKFETFNPAVFWAGSMTWTGGNNLSYATNGLYLSFIFMYYIKRRYTAWWEKYNYLVEAGFDVGVALSAILQFFALTWNGYTIEWWGNTVATQGLDFASYNQNSTLLPIPEVGYFGPPPGSYP